MNPDSVLTISASEAWPLSAVLPEVSPTNRLSFVFTLICSMQSVNRLRDQTQRHMSQTTDGKERAAATVSLQVLDALSKALASPAK